MIAIDVDWAYAILLTQLCCSVQYEFIDLSYSMEIGSFPLYQFCCDILEKHGRSQLHSCISTDLIQIYLSFSYRYHMEIAFRCRISNVP